MISLCKENLMLLIFANTNFTCTLGNSIIPNNLLSVFSDCDISFYRLDANVRRLWLI